MIEVVKFIGLLCAVWLFVIGAEPIQVIKRFFHVSNDSEPKDYISIFIRELINCALCSGFWFGLVYYQDFTLACLVSISSEIFYRLMNATLDRWL